MRANVGPRLPIPVLIFDSAGFFWQPNISSIVRIVVAMYCSSNGLCRRIGRLPRVYSNVVRILALLLWLVGDQLGLHVHDLVGL
jgi:hypothetical protein